MPEALWSNKSQLFRGHMLAPDSDKTVSPQEECPERGLGAALGEQRGAEGKWMSLPKCPATND